MPTIRYLSLVLLSLSASSQNFTWLRGQNTNGPITGTYGLQGTASASNEPGHRQGAATWVDASGNLWWFDGEGISSSTPMSSVFSLKESMLTIIQIIQFGYSQISTPATFPSKTKVV